MSNNVEDFEQPEFNHEEPVAKRGLRSNLAGAWQSQPLFKLFVLMVVVAAVVAVGVSFFSGSNSRSMASFVKPPELNEAPGGKASPYMKQQTELANSQRSQDALKSGGSALPTPIGQTGDAGDLNPNAAKDEQLTELRNEVANMNKKVVQMQQQPPPQQQQQPFDDSLATAMQKQMNTLAESWTPKGLTRVPVSKVETEENKKDKAEQEASSQRNSSRPKVVVPAGTVSYAQLLTEANSDVPGPILASIVSGPLAGARAVGSFQVSNGTADYLVLQFTVANLKGKDYALTAIALDPSTTLGGLATEVDQRYFTRVVLPAAAGFLQGFGSALYTGGTSYITNDNTTIVTQGRNGVRQGAYYGLGQAAQTASQFFQNQANQTKPLVRVAAGTPIGMFFVTSVTEPQNQADVSGVAGAGTVPQGYGQAGYGQGYAPAGYGQNSGYSGGYSPQIGGGYPGTTTMNYGSSTSNSGVPYPNYAQPNNLATPGITNYGGGGYGGYGGTGGNVIYTNR